MKLNIINPIVLTQLYGAPPTETIEVRFLRHDRHAEPNPVVRPVSAATVRRTLGEDMFDRLINNVTPTGRYAIEARGFVWEIVRAK